jgi:hypothetical protein
LWKCVQYHEYTIAVKRKNGKTENFTQLSKINGNLTRPGNKSATSDITSY